jgi:NAD(P)-dependent dehydrogenase (short-subunit alcohol dehydrogenase family)
VGTSPHPPSLIVTGATASVKGSAKFATFAAGKWAKRALAQSIAREYGPKGVHVAHAVIDGVITGPRTDAYSGVNGGAPDGKISADSVCFFFVLFNSFFQEKEKGGQEGGNRALGLFC